LAYIFEAPEHTPSRAPPRAIVAAVAKPARSGEVGMSPARLARVTELTQREIDAGTFAGAVTLVA
jgi:hypothetical protein